MAYTNSGVSENMIDVNTDGSVHFQSGNPGGLNITSATGLITTNAWHHVLTTYNGTTGNIFVNGVNVMSGTGSAGFGSLLRMHFGGFTLGGNPLVGEMKNCRLSLSYTPDIGQ